MVSTKKYRHHRRNNIESVDADAGSVKSKYLPAHLSKRAKGIILIGTEIPVPERAGERRHRK